MVGFTLAASLSRQLVIPGQVLCSCLEAVSYLQEHLAWAYKHALEACLHWKPLRVYFVKNVWQHTNCKWQRTPTRSCLLERPVESYTRSCTEPPRRERISSTTKTSPKRKLCAARNAAPPQAQNGPPPQLRFQIIAPAKPGNRGSTFRAQSRKNCLDLPRLQLAPERNTLPLRNNNHDKNT